MFIVYSKPACPQCVTAKNLLESKGIDYTTVEVNYGQDTTNELISREDFMVKFPTVRSLPLIVYDNGQVVGNLQQLVSTLNAKG